MLRSCSVSPKISAGGSACSMEWHRETLCPGLSDEKGTRQAFLKPVCAISRDAGLLFVETSSMMEEGCFCKVVL